MQYKNQTSNYFLIDHLSRRLWKVIGEHRRKHAYCLLLLMTLSAVLEAVSLGAVIPFLTVLAAPNQILENSIARQFAKILNIHLAADLALPLALTFATTAIVAGGARLILLWANNNLALATGGELSSEIFKRALHQPYEYHINRNSGEVISRILGQVGGTISFLQAVPVLFSSAILILATLATVFAINPQIAMFSFAGFGFAYSVVILLTQEKLRANSLIVSTSYTNSIKALQDGLGAIREILLDSTQEVFCKTFSYWDLGLRRAQAINAFLAGSPRYLMEAIGMVLIATLAYFISKQPSGFLGELPILGALALAAQRILPAMQQCYGAWAQMLGNASSLELVLAEMEAPSFESNSSEALSPIALKDEIRFQDVSFKYSNAVDFAIRHFSFSVKKGSRIGIVGRSGSGKSTMVDLLMALLEPTSGRILIDGIVIDEHLRLRWRKSIAHVPQSLYVSDASFAANIAFGVPPEKIRQSDVEAAAHKAKIGGLIESRSQDYARSAGERGSQISGGERQRLGIARALYRNASVLILDEATSSLDSVTERQIMESVDALDRQLTIFIVAHRISTIQTCNEIMVLDGGNLVDIGSYDWLIANSPAFNKLVYTNPK